MNFFETLDPGAREAVSGYMRPVRFAAGQCLMEEGDAGDGCYVIDSGEVRVELRHVETDSEAALCHLGPGALLGEFSLVDGEPRSASAYAQTDTVARWLSRTDFDKLCGEQPRIAVAVLNALSRQLTEKLRAQNRAAAEYLFSGDADRETHEMIDRARAAQKAFADWPEDRVDALLQDISESVSAQADQLAEVNVADTGIGAAPDKVKKIRFACSEVYRTLVGRPPAGPLREDTEKRVQDIASPMGVVLGIIPVTNPVSTIVFKTQICLKGRNALVFSCHRDALRLGDMTGRLIAAALERHGAPDGLVQWIKNRTDRRKTAMFMKHPGISFILATGGPSIVQAAYSSGTPAIGVGAGNAPALICADADLAAAAEKVIRGKSFDNGVICGSENNLVVVASAREAFVEQLEACGAAILTADETRRLTAAIFDPERGTLKREIVGKSAEHIAREAGLDRPGPPRLLVVPVELDELGGPYGHEKLAPVLSLFTVADEDEGIDVCKQILSQQGAGHTAIIHTGDEGLARRFGLEIEASRILVNVCGAQGCIGIGTGLMPSFTLGCGTCGGNSTTDNITYTHVLNVKRLALGG